ncbi:MAG TPA: carbohydrate-binding protein, partial [Polyangiaceae bacterium]|nr:carbohydrate-binding protein [Polyangiaceae bacterium]
VTGTVDQESSYGTFNGDMLHAHDLLEASGVPSELAITDPLVGGRSDLLGYFSWGSNDPNFDSGAYESLGFAPGSIGDTAVSTSGRTFLPTSGGQSLIADLIGHGLTGGKGYVGEPLLQAIASPVIALARYHAGYSLAESLYAASRFVGWEDVIIGDPLCTPYAGQAGLTPPLYAAAFATSTGGIQPEDCAEGGQDLGNIQAGSSTTYSALLLSSPSTFVARVASAGAGGTIEVHLDNASNASATCQVSPTGDWQTWTTVTCPFTGSAGMHDVSLLYSGTGGGSLFNAEWFAFR